MTPSDLLREAESRGVSLTAGPDGLHYRGPKGALTEELRDAIRAHQFEILALLGEITTAPGATPAEARVNPPAPSKAPGATSCTSDPAAIVAEWRALGADIRLDINTARDPTDDDAPRWLHLGKGWEYLPCPLRRRIQTHQPEIVGYLREEAIRTRC